MGRLAVAFFLLSSAAACGVEMKGTALEGDLGSDGDAGSQGGGAPSNSGGSGGTSVIADGANNTGATSGSGGDSGGGNAGGTDMEDATVDDGSDRDGSGGSPNDGGSTVDGPDLGDAGDDFPDVNEVDAAARCEGAFLGSTPFQPPGETDVHCYWVHELLSTFDKAESTCIAEGGHLATILSGAEDAFVTALVTNWQNDEVVWIGITDGKALHDTARGTLGWITGEPWTYSNWADGQPDHECLPCAGGQCCQHRGALLQDGTFWDRVVDAKYRFVCEGTP
jgi:hypothetical protein